MYVSDYGQNMKVPTTTLVQYVRIHKEPKHTLGELWKSIHSIHGPYSILPTFTSKNDHFTFCFALSLSPVSFHKNGLSKSGSKYSAKVTFLFLRVTVKGD